MNETTSKQQPSSNLPVDITKVGRVYSGKPGCMCGCRGSYRVASAHRAWATADRGYAYEDSEVNDKQVKRVVGILNGWPGKLEWDSECVSVEVNGRIYVAYFVPAAPVQPAADFEI